MEYKCYLCESGNIQIIHKGVRDNEGIDVLKCPECGLVFLSSFEHIDDIFYENSGMTGFNTEYEVYLKDGFIDAERRYNYLREKLVNKRVLDFGCGSGGFLFLAKEITARADGVELDKLMRGNIEERLSPLEGRVYSSMEDIQKSGQKYDIITMFHVIEHLPDPICQLQKLKSLLNDGGEIIIETPNSEDALLSLYECDSFADFTYWSCHLFLYSNETIKKLILKAGMNVNYVGQVQRYPISNHLYWLAHKKPGGHKRWSFIDEALLNESYGASLAAMGRADTIMASVRT